jgi:hypothetical protein
MSRTTRLARAAPLQTPRRCERCGRFDAEVTSRSIVGHKVRPGRTTRSAKATVHQLCSDCITAMEEEQPELFGETDAG